MSPNRSNIKSKALLFIGGGNMATAIIAGLIKANVNPKKITVVDHNLDKLQSLNQNLKINTLNKIEQFKSKADIVILAVKPFVIKQACKEVSNYIDSDTLIISVAAGVTINNLSSYLPQTSNIIRAMPNTPATIQQGITILYQNNCSDCSDRVNNKELTDELFKSVGQTVWVEQEQEINTTMAISGCGPAYVFLMCESLMAAGQHLGIDPKISKQLITATIEGACELYASSDKSAATLRKEVTSPNGTTEQALNTLNPENTKQLYINALEAAVKKAQLIEQNL